MRSVCTYHTQPANVPGILLLRSGYNSLSSGRCLIFVIKNKKEKTLTCNTILLLYYYINISPEIRACLLPSQFECTTKLVARKYPRVNSVRIGKIKIKKLREIRKIKIKIAFLVT